MDQPKSADSSAPISSNMLIKTNESKHEHARNRRLYFPAVFPLGTDFTWAWVNAMFKKAAQWPTRGERSSVSHFSLIKKAEVQTI